MPANVIIPPAFLIARLWNREIERSRNRGN